MFDAGNNEWKEERQRRQNREDSPEQLKVCLESDVVDLEDDTVEMIEESNNAICSNGKSSSKRTLPRAAPRALTTHVRSKQLASGFL